MARPPVLAILLSAAALAACGEGRQPSGGSQGYTCAGCHGAGPLGAPPPALDGSTAASDPRVGAHAAHLATDLASPPISCGDCHVLPRGVGDPGHFNPGSSIVTFGPRARAGGASPAYDRSTGTCTGTACHAQPGAAVPAPRWAQGPLPGERCGHCHGQPPPRPHPVWKACERCHGGGTPTAPAGAIGPGHLDGAVDATRYHPSGWIRRTAHGAAGSSNAGSCRPCHGPDLFSASSPLSCNACHGEGGCGACHGVPPATGAHARHHDGGGTPVYGGVTILADDGPGGGARYRFGCGQCHPVDDAHHLDGTVDVDLSPVGAPAGSLKARNGPGAAYVKAPGDPAGRCSEVACHSTGQDAPVFATTPRWDDPAGLGCDGCHGDPPRGASSGPDGATPNGHIYPYPGSTAVGGHVGGFPSWGHAGGSHGSATPGEGSSAVSCQACHFDTVDPAATGPSGFYWLDTTGNFSLPGSTGPDCAGCHAAASSALVRKGAVRPLRHVNGARDVAFDPRTSVSAAPGYAWPMPTPPRFPYWVETNILIVDRPDVALDGQTLSFHLAGATWDAATRTCSNVSCHLAQTQVRWGTPPAPGDCACRRCHADLLGPPPPGVCP